MITIILIVLLVLAFCNGTGSFGPDRRNTLWTVIGILLLIWLLFASGVIGDYGYGRN